MTLKACTKTISPFTKLGYSEHDVFVLNYKGGCCAFKQMRLLHDDGTGAPYFISADLPLEEIEPHEYSTVNSPRPADVALYGCVCLSDLKRIGTTPSWRDAPYWANVLLQQSAGGHLFWCWAESHTLSAKAQHSGDALRTFKLARCLWELTSTRPAEYAMPSNGDEKVSPPEPHVPSKYTRPITGACGTTDVDVYDVLKAFDVTCPALQHLIKKALCVGIRGHKTRTQDLNDILSSAQRAVELNDGV